MLDVFVADDSAQSAPSRPGMSPVVAIGGLHIPGESLRTLESGLAHLQASFGFPEGDEFKWSPGKDYWMRDGLVGERRTEFYVGAIELATACEARAIVVIEATDAAPATEGGGPPLMDAARLLLERIDLSLEHAGREGLVLVDRHGGGASEEREFLESCEQVLQEGTAFRRPQHVALSVMTAPSRSVRVLQLADVIVASTLAHVAGERIYSPPVFSVVGPLFARGADGNQGGAGLKIHPDYNYGNLYHWLLGQKTLRSGGGAGFRLPSSSRRYSTSGWDP